MSRKCLSLLSLVFVVVSLVRSFVFSGRWLRQIHLERVMSLSKSLSQNDVNELVLEYLATSGFSEAENTLRKELRGKTKPVAAAASTSRLEDLLEKSYVTQVASGEYFPRKKNRRSHLDAMLMPQDVEIEAPEKSTTSIDTQIISYNSAEGDPYGASVMPLYQTATFAQPGATDFGPYDYTRSGNPTRDSLQKQIAQMDGGARAFCFTTGMAALSAVTRLVKSGDEVIVNDDSYGGTYRLMSKVASRQGIRVRYVNMAGKAGPSRLADAINASTRLVMIESPTNPMQRICNIRELSNICHANDHEEGTLLSIDNTMMSPILSRPIEHGADIVIHSATKFMSGHSDTMAGAVIVADRVQGDKSLAESLYFYQNAEGTALAPFDCWLVQRGIKTMGLRVRHQMQSAVMIANWLNECPVVTKLFYAGHADHPDYDIHMNQSSGGGAVVCFCTGNKDLSAHIVSATKLFKITVSFGSVNSLISLPGKMSHASIPDDVKAAREFPEDLIRMSIGIESPEDLISDLQNAMSTFGKQIV